MVSLQVYEADTELGDWVCQSNPHANWT